MGDIPQLNPRALAPARLHCVKLIKAMASAKPAGELFNACSIAIASYGELSPAAEVLKAAVNAGSVAGVAFGAPLAPMQLMQSEYLAALRPLSALARLDNIRHVPFAVKTARVTASSAVSFIGEGVPVPASELSLD